MQNQKHQDPLDRKTALLAKVVISNARHKVVNVLRGQAIDQMADLLVKADSTAHRGKPVVVLPGKVGLTDPVAVKGKVVLQGKADLIDPVAVLAVAKADRAVKVVKAVALAAEDLAEQAAVAPVAAVSVVVVHPREVVRAKSRKPSQPKTTSVCNGIAKPKWAKKTKKTLVARKIIRH